MPYATSSQSLKCDARRYCLISPCRNEAEYLSRTIESVSHQSIPPALWVVVDDGSTDKTPQLLAEYSRHLPYLRIVRRADRGCRRVGAGVIEAFNEGLKVVDLKEYDYICKLDLDLDLPQRYFQHLIERMENNPRLGCCSGKPYYRTSHGSLVREACGDENAIGASKFYRRDCFEEIGGFEPKLMWDGIDGHRCRMLGWIAASWDDPEIRFEHLRPMGSSQTSIWQGRKRHGEGQYFMGTGFTYLVASAIYRLGSRPRIVGSAAMLWGYVSAAMRRAPRYHDAEFVEFLSNFHWRSLLKGKKRSVQEIEEVNEAVWRRHHSWHGSVPEQAAQPHVGLAARHTREVSTTL